MTFDKFYRSISYFSVVCGFFSLWVTGTFGLGITVFFFAAVGIALFIEGTKWQISERLGTTLIVLALPVFYLAYKMQVVKLYGPESALAGILTRMILSLAVIKLLQHKKDRDWIFLYLMAFFEVLLAAGLSISPLYLASFLLFVFVTLIAIVSLEIKRTAEKVELKRQLGPSQDVKALLPAKPFRRKVVSFAFVILLSIIFLSIPLFFMLPRVGGAGLGSGESRVSTYSGFSDRVSLGNIGRVQRNEAPVMRVKIDGASEMRTSGYFRGNALDQFDGHIWFKSNRAPKQPVNRDQTGSFKVNDPSRSPRIVEQTFYLEPLDTQMLFGLPEVISIDGNFDIVNRDAFGSVEAARKDQRVSYTVESDINVPSIDKLRTDSQPIPAAMQNYLQLPPDMDRRIADLAQQQTVQYGNRYDKAAGLTSYLQNNYGYTLDLKAGGDQPVAAFLFDVKEGHCEYFASALAVMLRTQGIASRVVTGFHGGSYNDATNVTLVRQSNAHAWVEVYFPAEDQWIQFDPTPYSTGDGENAFAGITGQISKYFDALETIWIQYFVAYDDQGQHSITHNLKDTLSNSQITISAYLTHTQFLITEWLSQLIGEERSFIEAKIVSGFILIASASLIIMFVGYRVIKKVRTSRRLRTDLQNSPKVGSVVIVEFYSEMIDILEAKGIVRSTGQTPQEFADSIGDADVIAVTSLYNLVRFGNTELEPKARHSVKEMLSRIGKPAV